MARTPPVADEPVRTKNMSFRAGQDNWLKIREAALKTGRSVQELMEDALSDYMKREKLGTLDMPRKEKSK